MNLLNLLKSLFATAVSIRVASPVAALLRVADHCDCDQRPNLHAIELLEAIPASAARSRFRFEPNRN
jgi:hypothetical protein